MCVHYAINTSAPCSFVCCLQKRRKNLLKSAHTHSRNSQHKNNESTNRKQCAMKKKIKNSILFFELLRAEDDLL